MRVKKFEAKTMKEALQMIKNDLGPDAVILSAKDNRKSFGLVGDGSVEVTAAVSEQTLHKKKFTESRFRPEDLEKFKSVPARRQKEIIEKAVDSHISVRAPAIEVPRKPITRTSYIDISDEEEEPVRKGRNVGQMLHDLDREQINTSYGPEHAGRVTRARVRQALETQPQQPNDDSMSSRAITRIRSAAKEALRAGLQTLEEPTETKTVPQAPAPQVLEVASLRNEIQRLQQIIEGFNKPAAPFVTAHPGADYGLSYDLSFMFQKLQQAGVGLENTVDILTQAQREIDPIQMKKRPLVDAWVARWFLNNIQVQADPYTGRVHLFVGGSGGGKTSALVKMASHLIVKEKKKVAILTTDSFKVGAADQLKIYCQILNVPFAIVRNKLEWEWVLNQLSFADHILVDFPGWQLKDLEEIQMFKSLLPPEQVSPICHLVVSTTSKDGDLFELARRYRISEYQDLIFSNLDQSVQHGVIYNVQRKTNKPLHSFGTGHRIPEDFEIATKERVLDLIFKLTKFKRETK